jgi:hypothetical protein
LTSIKRIAQTINQSNGFEYWLGFTVQTNWKTSPAATNYLAQWWSPKWNAAAADGYTAYVCGQNFNGASSSTQIVNVSSAFSGLYAAGAASGISAKGTAVTDANSKMSYSSATANGWTSAWCTGYRQLYIKNAALTDATVGNTVTFRAGWALSSSSTATSRLQSGATASDLSYVILDLAIALTVSAAATSAIASLTF